MKNFLLVYFLIVYVCSCASHKDQLAAHTPEMEQKYFAVLSYEKRPIIMSAFDSSASADFTIDTARIESIGENVVYKYNQSRLVKEAGLSALRPFKEYYKQVIGFKNAEGDEVVWVNCMCEKFESWETEYVDVQGGGNCYFNFFIYRSSDEVYSFDVNSNM